jgi:peroxin-19
MANMMGPGGNATSSDPNFQATVDQGADVFAKQLEESGIAPGDFLKQLLADVMAEEGGAGPSAENLAAAAAAAGISAPTTQASSTPAAAAGEQPDSFNDAIKRTMGRMKESGDKATAAVNEDDISDDMLAQLLKAVEAGASGAGEDGDLSKMFMGMMEQLSNKEMLYEPMKELDAKFGPWIEKNKGSGKVSAEDMERFETQARVVKQIVGKFEEKGFSDDDPKCREYVWERMQEVSSTLLLFGRGCLLIIPDASGWKPA